MSTDDLRRAVAEFIGTFALVFVGAGSVMAVVFGYGQVTQNPVTAVPNFGIVPIAFAAGLTIAVMVSAVGHISGGHLNPAVTLGFFVTGRIEPVLAGLYWVAQFGAAALAALLLRWIFPELIGDAVNLGAPALGAGIGQWEGVVLEGVLTAFLLWVFFATAADPRGTFRSIAGLAIGLTVTLDILVGGALTGAAVNPARAFGPELVANFWDKAWIWYAGPFAGAAIAALLYDFLYLRPVPRPPVVGTVVSEVAEPAPGEAAHGI